MLMGIDSTGTVSASSMPGRITFWTAADGTLTPLERLRIANNGWVGVGLVPETDFHIRGNTGVQTTVAFDTYGPTVSEGNQLVCRRARGTSSSPTATVIGDDIMKFIVQGSHNGTTWNNTAYMLMGIDGAGTVSASSMPGRIAFFTAADGTTSPVERLRIQADGAIGIGNVVPSAGIRLDAHHNTAGQQNYWRLRHGDNTNAVSHVQLQLQVGGASGGDPYVEYEIAGVQGWSAGIDNSDSDKFKFTANTALGANTFSIATNGDVSGTHGTYHTSSDQRHKTNIETVTDALSKVQMLRGVYYDWIEQKDERTSNGHEIGLIAQEVLAVIPEVVHVQEDDLGTMAVYYDRLVALLIEAVKELSHKNDALQEQINDIHKLIP